MNFFKVWFRNPTHNTYPVIIQEVTANWAYRHFTIYNRNQYDDVLYIEMWNGKKWETVPFKTAPTKAELLAELSA